MEGTVATFAHEQFGTAELGDVRLNRRLIVVAEQLVAHPRDSFPKKFQGPAELQGFYRLMSHERITHASVLAPHVAATLERMRAIPGVVLCLQDTTVLDYSGLSSIPELGQVGNGHGRGLYCHNCLTVDASTREVLGVVGQILHRRRRVPKGERRDARRNNPHRESLLWKRMSKSIPTAPLDGPPGQLWVDVADRGADITEFLDYEEQAGKKYVVRSQHDRWIFLENADENADENAEENAGNAGVVEKIKKIKLHELARSLPGTGVRDIDVQAKQGQAGRQAGRSARVSVSWRKIKIQPPRQPRGEERGKPLTAWVVRVWEATPPPGVEALEWILLTNVPVLALDDAFARIDWYGLRWIIEEYHKCQKTGCDIETMQFGHIDRLEPAISLMSIVAVRLLILRDQSRSPDAKERPATQVVPKLWVVMLSRWRHKEVRLNWTVHDFFFALARLGGHQNRKHDHRPGWLILWRGWLHLQSMLEGAAALGITEM